MTEQKFPWVVVVAGDWYIVARNGKNGTPEMGFHLYGDSDDAQVEADWKNKEEGIINAPKFDDDD